MTVQEEYEKRGWHFKKGGKDVAVAWRNVVLKDRRPGCIAVTSRDIVVRSRSCDSEQEFAEVIWEEKYVEQTYSMVHDNDPEFITEFLYDALEAEAADEVGEDLDGIWRHKLVT